MNSRPTLLLFAAFFFLMGAAVNLHAPLSYWDQLTVDWASTGGLAPIRTSLLSLIAWRGLGIAGLASVQLLRVVQVLGVLMTVPLVLLLAKELWPEDARGMLAASLYLLSPATIQGAQSLDAVDSSYLPAVFVAWVVCYLAADRWGWKGMVLLSGISAVAFGLKSTSSLGLFFVPAFAFVLANSGAERHRQMLKLAATAAGLLMFAVAWAVAPIDLRVGAAAGEVSSGLGEAFSPDFLRLAFRAAIGLAWWGPLTMILTGFGALRLWRREDYESRALLCGVATYSAAYLALGGMNHGYPRYHMAVLPILCVVAGGAAAFDGLRWKELMVAGAAVVLLVLVGDLIFGLNLGLRRAIVERTLRPHVVGESVRWAFWIVIPLVLVRFGVRARGARLAIAALASLVALGLIQLGADYNTGYEYGGSGQAEVIARAQQELPPGAVVMAPPSLSMRLAAAGFRGMSHPNWHSRATVQNFIDQSAPRAVLLGMTENSTEQITWLLHSAPDPFATCVGRFERIGSHWVCFPPPVGSVAR